LPSPHFEAAAEPVPALVLAAAGLAAAVLLPDSSLLLLLLPQAPAPTASRAAVTPMANREVNLMLSPPSTTRALTLYTLGGAR
jgi:hypothetical protein